MKQERKPYLSVGIDIGADFSLMAIALPTQEIVGKSYKILHSSTRSVQGAVDRILALRQTHHLPARVYMESTSIYHLPLYHRLKEAGLDVFVLNPIVTHANQNTNIRIYLPFEKPTAADISAIFAALFQGKRQSIPGGSVSLPLAQRHSVCRG